MAIYVKFAEEKKPKSIKEFLLKVFSSNCNCGYVRNVETYYDKQCKSVQCVKQKYRSFDDILELVQTYYKSATAKKVFKELLDLRPLNEKDTVCRLYMMSCSGIQRINLLYTPKSNSSENQISYTYNCTHQTFTSKYSWKQLFAKLNINSNDDLIKYLEENEK